MTETGTQAIKTNRLLLRQFSIGDAEDMFANWAADPEVTRFLTWPAHASADVTRRVIEDWRSRYEDGSCFNWAIEWTETGRVIGSIAVVRLDRETDTAEIGYCLSRSRWGQGIMPEALRAVMDYLFDTAGLSRIEARHDANNPRSGRVMEKAGLRQEGILQRAGKNNSGVCDLVIYAALAGDRTPAKQPRPAAPLTIRLAEEKDLDQVNELRRQVNELHVAGKPEVFKPGFSGELRDFVRVIFNDPQQSIVVAEQAGVICGFAVLHHIYKPENPFMYERDFLDIDEFCVDEAHRRQGIASAMIAWIRNEAEAKGYHRIELNMWEFNREALAFYESAGFATYRRYMEMFV